MFLFKTFDAKAFFSQTLIVKAEPFLNQNSGYNSAIISSKRLQFLTASLSLASLLGYFTLFKMKTK